MLTCPMDVLTQFPVRKTKAQKQAFRAAVQAYAEKQGYAVRTENGSFGARNLVIGDSENAKYLITAHYDICAKLFLPNLITPFNPILLVLYNLLHTALLLLIPILGSLLLGAAVFFGGILFAPEDSGLLIAATAMLIWYLSFILLGIYCVLMIYFGPANQNNANDNTSGVVTLLEIARTLPENQRHKVCFVLFDLDEKGLWGSKSYRKAHREATDQQLIINLDSVGDGDYLRMFPTKQLKQDRKKLTSLYIACGYFGKKSLLIHEKGFGYNPSDHKHFPYGIGICALRKKKKCYYLGRIHTKKDTVLEQTNVNILRAALTTFICCAEVN